MTTPERDPGPPPPELRAAPDASRPRRLSPFVFLLLIPPFCLVWLMTAPIQGALGWGMRGEEKPFWFVALSFFVWIGAPLGLVLFVTGIVVWALIQRALPRS